MKVEIVVLREAPEIGHTTHRIVIDGKPAGLLTMTSTQFTAFHRLVRDGCSCFGHAFEISREGGE